MFALALERTPAASHHKHRYLRWGRDGTRWLDIPVTWCPTASWPLGPEPRFTFAGKQSESKMWWVDLFPFKKYTLQFFWILSLEINTHLCTFMWRETERDTLNQGGYHDLDLRRKTANQYINYEHINVMVGHTVLFVVILNPIKLSGVLSMNLEYDKKKQPQEMKMKGFFF